MGLHQTRAGFVNNLRFNTTVWSFPQKNLATMGVKFFQNCCRLCLAEEKQHMEIESVAELADMLQKLYGLNLGNNNLCSRKVCVDCFNEAKETQKWLDFYEHQKKLVAENQQRFEEALLLQLGPEPEVAEVCTPTTAAMRASRASRRSAHQQEPTKSPTIKKENSLTRSKSKMKWEDESYRETPSDEASPVEVSADEEEVVTSETGTSSTDADLKCPRCEVMFDDIHALEKHTCEFICSICNSSLKTKHSLKRHILTVHKIKSHLWQNYWNTTAHSKASENLLVVASKPKKRYRYESDSPTDIETDSDPNAEKGELTCKYCVEKFDNVAALKSHNCDYNCNICGFTFASRGNVRRHKIRVHKVDPEDPSVQPDRSRSRSRAASRPPSPAAGNISEDDQPLSAFAAITPRRDDTAELNDSQPQATYRFRFHCPRCEYSSYKRCSVRDHLTLVHKIPAEEVDVNTITKEQHLVTEDTRARSKTPNPSRASSKTPDPYRSRSRLSRPITPAPPRISDLELEPIRHRSRCKSTTEELEFGKKRKRSLSSCSNKSSRYARASSIPPGNRQILTAKRRISPQDILAKIPLKLRPTVNAINSCRLFVSALNGCEPVECPQPLKMRASSYMPLEPCPTKRLVRLRPPIGQERKQVQGIRSMFHRLSNAISPHSKFMSMSTHSSMRADENIHPHMVAPGYDVVEVPEPAYPHNDIANGLHPIAPLFNHEHTMTVIESGAMKTEVDSGSLEDVIDRVTEKISMEKSFPVEADGENKSFDTSDGADFVLSREDIIEPPVVCVLEPPPEQDERIVPDDTHSLSSDCMMGVESQQEGLSADLIITPD